MKNQTALEEYLLDLKLRNCSPRTIKTEGWEYLSHPFIIHFVQFVL